MTKVIARGVFVFTLFATVGLWLFSHFYPESFGTCHEVPLNIGTNASIRECQAYGPTEFVVPLAVALISLLVVSSADLEFTIPGLGTIKRTREGKEAAQVLKEEDTFDERAEEFLQQLPPNPPAAGSSQQS